MAEPSITASAVIEDANGDIVTGIAGGTIAQGQSVYLDAATSTYKLADANASAATAAAVGIALSGASAGQRVRIQRSGTLTVNAVLAAAGVYVVGATPGSIAPVADVTTGWYTTIMGVALTTTTLKMPSGGPLVSGVIT